ncbi:phage holin family protein [uncultured Aquabacterium sp.]|jgi:uncharacterized membrane protein YqjE|uniref:phage holin family protein n=1 Tax=uncultured Aquabacterium sp. TaxID=158753 RepID=UPI0026293607|nr:phage holin family protein [uncultured Aquabacterium sp.]
MGDTAADAATASGRLTASLRGLLATLVALGHDRLALASIELEEERDRLLATLAWGAAAVVLACFALAFAAVFVTVLFWDTHRLLALGSVTLMLGAAAGLAWWRIRSLWAGRAGLLPATLAELEADRRALMGEMGGAPGAAP